jgi:hypothetical protein
MKLALLLCLVATPVSAQVVYPPPNASTLATKAEVAQVQASMPAPSTTAPPSVADNSATGTMTTQYALANHTHASKARKGRVLVPSSGVFDVTFGAAFSTGAPLCVLTAETTAGDTNVVNAQVDGVTTMTGFRIRITRTAITVASLLGLSILSVPAQVATYAHYICIEP